MRGLILAQSKCQYHGDKHEQGECGQKRAASFVFHTSCGVHFTIDLRGGNSGLRVKIFEQYTTQAAQGHPTSQGQKQAGSRQFYFEANVEVIQLGDPRVRV